LRLELEKFSRKRMMTKQDGVTLLELIVVLAIFGIVASLATLGLDGWHRSRLVSATGGLLSDLQTVRMSAMTESSALNGRGFGLRFIDNNSYKVFEFVDKGTTPYVDFNYEDTTEEVGGYENELGNGISIDPDPTGQIILYDKRGMSRTTNWSSVANKTYVVRHSSLAQGRCVTISQVRIREGVWNATTSNCEVR